MIDRYPEYIMRYLRLRRGMEETDTSMDEVFSRLDASVVFHEVLNWEGLLGGCDESIKCWILDIYGVDLDDLEVRE